MPALVQYTQSSTCSIYCAFLEQIQAANTKKEHN